MQSVNQSGKLALFISSILPILWQPALANPLWENQAVVIPDYVSGYELRGQESQNNTRTISFHDHYNQQAVRLVLQPRQQLLEDDAIAVKQNLQQRVPSLQFVGEFNGKLEKQGATYPFKYIAYRYTHTNHGIDQPLLGHSVLLHRQDRSITVSQVGPQQLGTRSKTRTARYSASRLFSLLKALDWQDGRW